ncbi:MAG: hypothetical protein JSV89_01965 [Spirochaetaceae bacterium]|nr:MAG: hypothetical protein JSV89_01965 [Spirochaetaceae bacterium]
MKKISLFLIWSGSIYALAVTAAVGWVLIHNIGTITFVELGQTFWQFGGPLLMLSVCTVPLGMVLIGLEVRSFSNTNRVKMMGAVCGKLHRDADKLGRQKIVLEIPGIQSMNLLDSCSMEQAVNALGQAVALAEPRPPVWIFLDDDRRTSRVRYQAAKAGIHREYGGRVATTPKPSRDGNLLAEVPEMFIEPLSRRETEVLELLARGASNKEVARLLYISLHTVKWHTANIYGKLCVENRTQAVAKARALGLLSAS